MFWIFYGLVFLVLIVLAVMVLIVLAVMVLIVLAVMMDEEEITKRKMRIMFGISVLGALLFILGTFFS